ncbi:MAG TPA: prolyl oligopeptidase family serine peptidase [Vicinamibacterales bacterium]|nr:prolyl oligopeptidase family serine peptidase [Vicinamibacterales bacterium]
MKKVTWFGIAAAGAWLAVAPQSLLGAQAPLQYPATKTVDHVDTYHGTKIADPYRWLEDDTSAETAAWVEAQNKVTFAYLDKIPYRAQLTKRLNALYNYAKYSSPSRKGEYYFFSKNDGLQNQSVLYIQKGLTGTPEVLIDPNTWSEDGTFRLMGYAASKDGKLLTYGVSRSGSDWQEYRVLDLATRKLLDDKIEWVKVSGIAWRGNGFYYSRYPAPAKGKELSSINEDHMVYYHRIGTPQSADELVFRDEKNPQRFHTLSTTEDERFAVLEVSDRGTGKQGNAILVMDVSKPGAKFTPLIPEISDDTYSVLESVRGELLVFTDKDAPNGRVVRIDPAKPGPANWKIILPEKQDTIDSVAVAGGKVIATYMKDVASKAYVHNLEGALENEIELPGLGSVSGFGGNMDDTSLFYSFTSFTYPTSIFRYEVAARKSSLFRAPQIPGLDTNQYETRQVFFTSKDGAKVPMFLVHKKGLVLDGNNPTLMYGYGGFNIATTPGFNSLRIALLEQGFVYASVNMRGGSEYGEAWHDAGTKLKKQNVFDDFIGGAEWLIANKYTNPSKLAAQGGSNGGLLVGAVINQRPDLFRVAIPQVGVMDMLRFHKFTIGWNWIADYGSSDNADEFKALRAYSPLHNIKSGAKYPATLITTADHDDRVVPAHSFKYAATLQKAASAEQPVLIRIDTKSGHGASNVTKQIEATADIYAFIMYNLGVTPKF